ncbi:MULTISPECIES: M48 family metallopeptidase [Nostocales]|jgi:Zn-dependent protease with chaperone function|uniref:M48 family metallopeptidase n=2 Tax=Aphanizomenonaceae TaxID=1892259 RepID=A0ACC7S4L0_DOLFA|nr:MULTISPECIES: M48 family metallopeptidase [Nostocales]MBO1069315.1 M48 family metallopeptidase [Dolichospermum sp. DEX189]MCX5980405.1 M48 family metallopeptidase [Nostocales cyanobacterium LacPavin_0920_SED1_MAG_38_18]MBD2278499.1 M48 family metallopeptidase [Aphanizomenon flos-aquae FACHB-1040]MBO1064395.1 M48 family metallopeptidase [Anabaena sp. 54]MTJ43246.1 M48 family metallopeptidase [Dolichospermum flos-aquae UHCC 0037]
MPTYPGISSEAFRHPLDSQAEQALRSLPGFDLIARKFVEFVYERPQLVYLMGNSIQVGPRQYSTIYQIFRECVRDLDISGEPGLFIAQNAQVNSYALGQEHPYIVVNTGLLDLLNEAELRTVLAHELGHIKCGHTILIQMAMWAMNAASVIGELTFGLGNIVSQGLIYAFFEWRRKAELSADRAALLVMDDLNPVMSSMMKLSGGSHKYAHECSLQEFIQQSEKYQALDDDGLNQVYKFLLYNGGQGMMLSHPFPVERLHYLRSWAVSEEYQQIKKGNYQRSADGSVDVTPETPDHEAEKLRKEIEKLQAEINKMRKSD